MPVEFFNFFFAMLFFGAMAVVLFALVMIAWRLITGSLPRPVAALVGDVAPLGLWFAWMASVTATAGSLYYSEIANFRPCVLCWYQRYAMYPSAAILTLALLLRRPKLAWGAVALSAVGIAVSTFHRVEEEFPDLGGGVCDPLNPCSLRWVNTFGFITIPTMAWAAFALVLLFVPLALRQSQEVPNGHDV